MLNPKNPRYKQKGNSKLWVGYLSVAALSLALICAVVYIVFFGPGRQNGPGGDVPVAPEGTPQPTQTAPAATEPVQTPEPTPTATPKPLPIQTVLPSPTPQPLRLAGVKVGIDPGHQKKGDYKEEPVAPGSKKTKPRTSSGTQGVFTRNPEYEVVLDISLQLKESLEALGAQVYMTREINEVTISNIERAQMMNEHGVDICLRIHLNGSENSKKQGIGLYVSKSNDIAQASYEAAEKLLPEMVKATGAKDDGIHVSDTYSGLNWSEVPSILVEMGYMSNKEEDIKTSSPEYQALLVEGMTEGVAQIMGR